MLDEVDFKVSTLVSALANNHVIQNLCWLLKFYKSNSTRTNRYIICILRKICDDLELSQMLYQVRTHKTSYLRIVSSNEESAIYMYIFCLTKFCSYHSSPYSTTSYVSRSHVHVRIMKILFVS